MPNATQPVCETLEGLPTPPLSTSLQPVSASKPAQLRPFLRTPRTRVQALSLAWKALPHLQGCAQMPLLSGTSPTPAQAEHLLLSLCLEHRATDPRQSKRGSGASATCASAPSMALPAPQHAHNACPTIKQNQAHPSPKSKMEK